MKITVTQHGEHSTSFYQFEVPEGCERVEFFKDSDTFTASGVKLKDEATMKIAQGGFFKDVAFIVYHMKEGAANVGLLKHEGLPAPYITVS